MTELRLQGMHGIPSYTSPSPLSAHEFALASDVNYQAGPLGNFYLASGSPLLNAGSRSAADADTIVRYRAEHGSFKSIQDLIKVPGIDTKKIESNRDRVEF